ncbi:MAG: hypothetical protein K8S98_01110 [Planctomycetes bacterium]|nr:hypothetical protein [Planctomycetota bacterium]
MSASQAVNARPSAADFALGALDFEGVRALFERLASTSLGRRGLRELAPRSDADARCAGQRVREMRWLEESRSQPSLAGVCDPLPAFEAARQFHRPFERDEFAHLFGFVGAALRLAPWFALRKQDAPAIHALFERFPDLSALAADLARALDERGEIKDDASAKLAKLRRELRELSNDIESRLRRIATAARDHLSDGSIHRRGRRLVLAVKSKSQGKVSGLVHDRSQSGETVFVEPREVIEDQNRRAELASDEEHEVRRILVELTRHALDAEGFVRIAATRLAELEIAVISSAFCAKYGARPLDVAGEEGRPNGLLLREARHPLLVERLASGALDEVVPIDVRLGDEFDLLVITGPNTGGKTLALKTVGLAACMARLGLPFPCAEGSRVPLYDGVVADIGDEQEIAQDLSTFSSHLARVRAGLDRAGPKTLFLLDELGGGTDPDEGAALSDALLEHLLEKRAPTVATTHLGKLKEFAFRHARAENASAEFDAATLRPRFRLLVGTPGESCALHIAARLGLPKTIVENARRRIERRDAEAQELMRKMRGAREAAERARKDTEQKLVDLRKTEDEALSRIQDLKNKSELLEAEAQRGLEERVREARARLKRAFDLLPQLSPKSAESMRDALDQVDQHLSGAALSERRRAFLIALKKGGLVYIPRYKQRCVITKVDRSKESVSVRLGTATLSVPFDEVTSYESL